MSTLTVKELFDFVTDATITEDNIDLYLEKAMTLASERSTDDITEQQKVDEEVKTIQSPMTAAKLQHFLFQRILSSWILTKFWCVYVLLQVFKHSFIPRNLDEVIDFERDVILAKEGQTEGVCEVLCIQRNCDIKIRTKLCVSVDWISCKYFFYYYYTELTYNLCPCLIRQRFFLHV